MAMLDFLKKKKETEAKTDVKQEIQTSKPQKPEKVLTELPEFPTMAEEDFSPLPKIEPLGELEKSEIKIPSLEETSVEKPVIHPEKSITPEVGKLKKEVEEQEIELPPGLGEKFEKPRSKEEVEPPVSLKEEAKKRFVPEKIKTTERRTVSPKKPVFVNVKSYQGISNEIDVIINILENSEEVVKRLNNIKIRENNELKKMHDSLDGLNKKIIAVDDILSKG